jgi:hypothetical protein
MSCKRSNNGQTLAALWSNIATAAQGAFLCRSAGAAVGPTICLQEGTAAAAALRGWQLLLETNQLERHSLFPLIVNYT